jgi:hypothetical protein
MCKLIAICRRASRDVTNALVDPIFESTDSCINSWNRWFSASIAERYDSYLNCWAGKKGTTGVTLTGVPSPRSCSCANHETFCNTTKNVVALCVGYHIYIDLKEILRKRSPIFGVAKSDDRDQLIVLRVARVVV